MLYVSIKSSSAARNANDNALEIYLSDLLIRHWMKYWKECRRRGRGGCTRIIGICNEHVKMNKNRQISLEILWRHKCTVSSFLSPLRKGSVNLERFHYLRKHFSVGFFLMNINGESEKGYFFSLLPLFFFCLFSFTFHREIVQRALNKPDLRGTWCARTTSASEYSRGTGWRINIFFLCTMTLHGTHLGEIDLQCAATGVYVRSVKCLLRSRRRFHWVKRDHRTIRLRKYIHMRVFRV